jgi:toxin ParE1/3/4
MNYKVSIREKAFIALDEFAEDFNGKQNGLGLEFLTDFDSAIQDLQLNPLKYQVRYRGTRIKHIKRFKIGVHYLVESQTVFVLAVLHNKDNPKKWP